jgi:MoxR-like ATPase
MVLATQNPYEFQGTYFLPESQLDRFMLRVHMGYPDRRTEKEILSVQPSRTRLAELQPVLKVEDVLRLQAQVLEVRVDDAIEEYVLSIAEATRRSEELTVGLSPRGSLALLQAARAKAILDGRDYVVPDDVKLLATGVCAHRVISHSFGIDGAPGGTEGTFERILQTVPVPQ